ncbi:HEAT repeat domain-containing protein [Kosmotoga pacifica]|nr:HEAT repeat domain-containing protein [Kosmotoga pacifica]
MNKGYILTLLNSSDPLEKLRALKLIREEGLYDLAETMVEMLKRENDEMIIETIVDTLKEFNVPEVSQKVVTLFDEKELYLKDLAVLILTHHYKAAIPVLREKLKSNDKHQRKLALDALILMNKPELVDTIAVALEDDEVNNVIAAVEAIGALEGEKYASKILDILRNTEDSFLKMTCLEVLTKIGNEIIFKEVNILFPEPSTLPEFLLVPYLKLATKFPYRDYLAVLLELMKEKGQELHREVMELAESYIKTNKELTGKEKKSLCAALWQLHDSNIPPMSKYEILRLVGTVKCDYFEDRLISLLQSEDLFEQIGAIEALVALKTQRAIKAIEDAISKASSPEFREIAREAIKKVSE